MGGLLINGGFLTPLQTMTSAKSAVIWIILKCYFVVNLLSFTKLFFLRGIFSNFFNYMKTNKPNIHNKIIDIASLKNELNNLFLSTGLYLKSNVLVSHKGENMFFNFWALLLKMYIFAVVTFFLA